MMEFTSVDALPFILNYILQDYYFFYYDFLNFNFTKILCEAVNLFYQKGEQVSRQGSLESAYYLISLSVLYLALKLRCLSFFLREGVTLQILIVT